MVVRRAATLGGVEGGRDAKKNGVSSGRSKAEFSGLNQIADPLGQHSIDAGRVLRWHRVAREPGVPLVTLDPRPSLFAVFWLGPRPPGGLAPRACLSVHHSLAVVDRCFTFEGVVHAGLNIH